MMPIPYVKGMDAHHVSASRVVQVHFSGDFEGDGNIEVTTALLRSIFRRYGDIQVSS